VVGSDYDPMLAKVIAHGTDRAEALRRLDAALRDTVLLGIGTNVGFLRALLADPDVLLLDEPLGALDPATGRLVLDVVRRRARTLVLISQE
jgi:acetyl/propionyl-CoA carboxylase alpha subunit